METYIIIGIALIVGLIVVRFVFKSLKLIIEIGIVALLVGVGMHFFAPEYLDKAIGKENHDKVVKITKDGINKIEEIGSDVFKKLADSTSN